jgi:hypothetical protein
MHRTTTADVCCSSATRRAERARSLVLCAVQYRKARYGGDWLDGGMPGQTEKGGGREVGVDSLESKQHMAVS